VRITSIDATASNTCAGWEPTSTLECTAANGGTTAPFYPQTQQELIDDLT
jgi:hypothetical protein